MLAVLYSSNLSNHQKTVKILEGIKDSYITLILVIESITIYLREARKYFGGIMLASQSIRDYVPEGSGAEAIDDLKKIFELTQYKFIFHQETNVLGLFDRIFENTVTQSQRDRIPKLEVGETILCISSDRNLEFKVHLTNEENRIFQGGV